ncbi:unnamed protein product [Mycena citricolor]|uniref:C2 domain-containing protein n=1 Tax=Mycena citricolor TaxID=2018698 RepID=A0AAD2JUR8_9AGAR|nr:unnamed protein product [Mycena citricolor]
MKLSCFADDPREPDLIGQTDVDLTEVLTKGETDEWFDLSNKDKFAGKVYLELTFWSNEPPPEKKVAPAARVNGEYSGPGSFVTTDDVRRPPDPTFSPNRIPSMNASYNHSGRQSDAASSTMRPATSLAQVDTYRSPYEQPPPAHRGRVSSFTAVTNGLADMAIGPAGRRRESLPPTHHSTMYTPRHSSATYPPPQQGYEPSVYESSVYEPSAYARSTYEQPYEQQQPYEQRPYEQQPYEQQQPYEHHQQYELQPSYDRPRTPPGPPHEALPNPYGSQPPHRPTYETNVGAGYSTPLARGRYSLPTTSSGFVLSSSNNDAGFSRAPPPANYSSHMTPSASYGPISSQPTGQYPPSLPPSGSFHVQQTFPPQGIPPSHSFPYSQFQTPQTTGYNGTNHSHVPNNGHSSPGHPSAGHTSPPSPGPPLNLSSGPGSRPLPPQPQLHSGPPHVSYGLPQSASQSSLGPPLPGAYSPTLPSNASFHQLPPPPPPPPLPQSGTFNDGLPSPHRQSSLPPPPSSYLPLPPPPPPPPLDYDYQPQPQPQPQPYYPGPPPRPPVAWNYE